MTGCVGGFSKARMFGGPVPYDPAVVFGMRGRTVGDCRIVSLSVPLRLVGLGLS